SVLGRPSYGGYPAESYAIVAQWTVDASAPATVITGAPASPSRSRLAALSVGGVGVTDYRWTINNGFYRAETPVATPLVFTNLAPTQQLVQVIGKIGGTFQPTNNPTSVSFVT